LNKESGGRPGHRKGQQETIERLIAITVDSCMEARGVSDEAFGRVQYAALSSMPSPFDRHRQTEKLGLDPARGEFAI
jgi:hypothetical protein